jgi:hypothetical protein
VQKLLWAFAAAAVLLVGSSAQAHLNTDDVTPGVSAVPEPSSIALVGLGAAGLLGYAWRRRRAKA